MYFSKDKIKKEFEEYTAAYDLSDPKIKLKYEHTYKVASLCEDIAVSLDLSKEDIDIAWICGMLHDIGRFEQVKRYGTFFDSKSVDHAQFGADLLFKEGLYERFVDDGDEDKKSLIEKAIRVHNVFRLPENLSERERMFSNILRDADKIDILRVNCETPTEDVYNVTTEELKKAEVSDDVIKAFKEKRCAKRHDRTSAVDYLVGHICLTFELVYPKSLELMFSQGYLFKLLLFKSDNEKTNEWFEYMNHYMKEYMNECMKKGTYN